MEEAKKYPVYKVCSGCQGNKEIKLNPRRSREATSLTGGGPKGRDEGEMVTCTICKGVGKLSTGQWVEIEQAEDET